MNMLMTVLGVVILIGCMVLCWCLYKLYDEATNRTKRIAQFVFWGLLIVLFFTFTPLPLREKAIYRGVIGAVAAAIVLVAYWFLILLPVLIKKIIRMIITKVKQSKLDSVKIEIVNSEKYIELKKRERITFLQKLQKQTNVELVKLLKELDRAANKMKDLPEDVAKYIKHNDTYVLQKNVYKLKNKLMAIEDLLESETGKNKKMTEQK